MEFNIEKGLYTFGRIISVVIRPLILYIVSNFFSNQLAIDFGVVFLAISLSLVLVAADVHRNYYIYYFSKTDEEKNNIQFYVYVFSIIILAIIGSLISFIISLKSSLFISFFALLYFISEKMIDELLRFELFKKNFLGWGKISSLKGTLQLISLFIFFLIFGKYPLAWSLIFVFTLINFFIFYFFSRFNILYLFRFFTKINLLNALINKALKHIFNIKIIWVWVLLNASIGYFDRLIILQFNKSLLPFYMLSVTCFSVIQMGVDFFYLSKHRSEFLEQKISLLMSIKNKLFIKSIFFSICFAILGYIGLYWTSKDSIRIPLIYVFLIAINQIMFAINLISQQILYWRSQIVFMIKIDLFLWFTLLTCSFFFYGTSFLIILLTFFITIKTLITFNKALSTNEK